MKPVHALARKEFRAAWNSPVAYAISVAFLVFSAAWLYFVRGFYAAGLADLRPYFGIMPVAFAVLAPAATMRSWAEERRLGTYELLLTMPFTEAELVLGKFLAAYATIAIALALTLPVPLLASLLGSFDPGVLAGQYLGALLVAGASTAVGIWVSSLAKNQASAFVGAALLLIGLSLVDRLAAFFRFSGPAAAIANWVSTGRHFESLSRGVLDGRDFAYYLSAGAAFLYLTAWNVRRRKWS